MQVLFHSFQTYKWTHLFSLLRVLCPILFQANFPGQRLHDLAVHHHNSHFALHINLDRTFFSPTNAGGSHIYFFASFLSCVRHITLEISSKLSWTEILRLCSFKTGRWVSYRCFLCCQTEWWQCHSSATVWQWQCSQNDVLTTKWGESSRKKLPL